MEVIVQNSDLEHEHLQEEARQLYDFFYHGFHGPYPDDSNAKDIPQWIIRKWLSDFTLSDTAA